jgi:hypothetical protein
MFATVFILLYAAHMLADYALQTDHQAEHKAERSRAGWCANLAHAGTHVLTCTVALAVGAAVLSGTHFPVTRAIVALAWVGASHGLIDRRWLIAWWMDNTGSADFRTRGGAQHVDQTAHILALCIAAFIIAT